MKVKIIKFFFTQTIFELDLEFEKLMGIIFSYSKNIIPSNDFKNIFSCLILTQKGLNIMEITTIVIVVYFIKKIYRQNHHLRYCKNFSPHLLF